MLNEARSLFGDLIDECTKEYGQNSLQTFSLMWRQTRVLDELNRREDALKLAQTVTDLAERLYGRDSFRMVMALSYQAKLIRSLGRGDECEHLMDQAQKQLLAAIWKWRRPWKRPWVPKHS